MAINKNHEFENLDGVKCAIVEKYATAQRVGFLKNILDYNSYKVIVVASPPPKTAPVKPAAAATEEIAETLAAPTIETFTIGVTDVMFNPTNAIFGRLLKAPHGHVVTLAYWNQKENTPLDEVPYYEKK